MSAVRCPCGGEPYTSPKLDEMRRQAAIRRAEQGLPPAGPRKPLCASCLWANIQRALDPAQDINAPGGEA